MHPDFFDGGRIDGPEKQCKYVSDYTGAVIRERWLGVVRVFRKSDGAVAVDIPGRIEKEE